MKTAKKMNITIDWDEFEGIKTFRVRYQIGEDDLVKNGMINLKDDINQIPDAFKNFVINAIKTAEGI